MKKNEDAEMQSENNILDNKVYSKITENDINDKSDQSVQNDNSDNGLSYDGKLMELYENNLPIIIPSNIYNKLPPFLREFIDTFKPDDPNRDAAYLSILAHVSSICHQTVGLYHGRMYAPNIFTYIVGEAASGKGNAIYGRELFKEIDDFFHREFGPFYRFLISGNNSRAMLINRIAANEGIGMISETEGDTISVNYKSDWGNSSADHRCAFQNERISMERAKDKSILVIENPRYSMMVTMTPGQVSNIVGSRENGLYSRILFYTLDRKPEFTSPKSAGPAAGRFKVVKALSGHLLQWYLQFKNVSHEFVLTDEQWHYFTNFWESRFKIWIDKYGLQEADLIFRLGLSSFKIAMTLHTIELTEPAKDGIIHCENGKLEASLKLCEVLFYHSLKVNDMIEVKEIKQSLPYEKFLSKVDNEFSTGDFVKACESFGISARTAKRHIFSLVQAEIVSKKNHGVYVKNQKL